MEKLHLLDIFQGLATLAAADPKIFWGRIGLTLFGFLLVYLGKKGILEALLMIPMGLGMASVNAGVMFFEANKMGIESADHLALSVRGLEQHRPAFVEACLRVG